MVSLFEERHRERIVSIWNDAFSDCKEYINKFFDSNCAKTYVYCEDEIPIATLSVFDVFVAGRKGAYIYALVVDKLHRGKKIASTLIEAVQKNIATIGYDFSLVVPSPYNSLEFFYKKLGFDKEITLGATQYQRVEKHLDFVFEKATLNEYKAARQNVEGAVIHSDDFFAYVYDDLLSEGAEVLKITTDKKEAYCVCYNKDNCVIIKEFIGDVFPETISQIVMNIFNFPKSICVFAEGENRYPFALLKRYNADLKFDKIYANLLLDDFENRL